MDWDIDQDTDLSLSVTCKGEALPHDIVLCNFLCPPISQESWCTYVISEVLSDPVNCTPDGIVNGATICVTPCIVPGDIAVCDPDDTGTAKLQIIDDDCLFRVIPVDGCTTCPPGTPRWRRLN